MVYQGGKVDGLHQVDQTECFVRGGQCMFVGSRLVGMCQCRRWRRNPICRYL